MTPLTPPRGFGVSSFRLGIKWMWQWKIVCPASWPSFMPMLKPVTDWSCSKMPVLWEWMTSGKVLNSMSFRSKKDGTCLLGMINVWSSVTGKPSRITQNHSLSNIIRSGGRLQNGQSSDIGWPAANKLKRIVDGFHFFGQLINRRNAQALEHRVTHRVFMLLSEIGISLEKFFI